MSLTLKLVIGAAVLVLIIQVLRRANRLLIARDAISPQNPPTYVKLHRHLTGEDEPPRALTPIAKRARPIDRQDASPMGEILQIIQSRARAARRRATIEQDVHPDDDVQFLRELEVMQQAAGRFLSDHPFELVVIEDRQFNGRNGREQRN